MSNSSNNKSKKGLWGRSLNFTSPKTQAEKELYLAYDKAKKPNGLSSLTHGKASPLAPEESPMPCPKLPPWS